MPVFNNLGLTIASSGSEITASFPVLDVYFNSPSYGAFNPAATIGSIQAQVINYNNSGSAGEILFNVTSLENSGSSGVPVLVIAATGSNNEPRVGVGFTGSERPIKAFDVKSKTDTAEGTEFLIRSSRLTEGAQIGDLGGSIRFVIDSSSFGDITSSGSVAEIDSIVTDVTPEGVRGDLSLKIGIQKEGNPTEVIRFRNNDGAPLATLTGSLVTSGYIRSADEIIVGDVTIDGTGVSANSFTASADISASGAILTTIAGPSDQLVELGNYPIGYDVASAFPITGSGIIVSASTLASNHYNMIKVGDIELVDLKSLINPNTFLIHNVDQFSITSGSDSGDIASANYLMTHTGESFVLHNNGSNMLSITNGAVSFTTNTTQFTVQNSTGDINLIPATGDVKHRVNNTATTSSVHSFSVYDADPSTTTGASVKNLPASDVILKGTIISGSLVYFGEESGDLSTGVSNGYQFSYGNGATGTIGIPVPVDCYAKKLMFQAETFGTSCTIDLYTGSITTNPATDTGEGMTITGTEHGKVVDINPVFIAAGHYPIFRTTATSGTYGNVRVGVFLEYPMEIGV